MTMMAEKPLLIDIGAGNIQLEGYTTIDVVDHFHPDHLAPITSLPFADGTVDGARAAHVLEHLLPVTIAIDPITLEVTYFNTRIVAMNEVWRVLKVGARFEIEVPIFPYWTAIADPTHIGQPFVPQSFWYFTKKDYADQRAIYGVKPWKMVAAERNSLGSIMAVVLEKVAE